MALFGDRVPWVYSMPGVLIKRSCEDTAAHRESATGRWTQTEVCGCYVRNAKVCHQARATSQGQTEQSPSRVPEGACPHLDSWLPASRAVRQWTSVALSQWVCGTLLQQTQETNARYYRVFLYTSVFPFKFGLKYFIVFGHYCEYNFFPFPSLSLLLRYSLYANYVF